MTLEPQSSPTEDRKPDNFGDGAIPTTQSKRRGLGILDHPDVQQAVTEDPLFRFIAKWWRQLLVLGLAIGLGLYARQKFQETSEGRLSEAAEIFSRVHRQYESIVATRNEIKSLETEKKKKSTEKSSDQTVSDLKSIEDKLTKAQANYNEARRLMTDSLATLSDSVSPYDSIARLYSGLLAFATDDLAKATEELAPLSSIWSDGNTGDSQKLLSELAALSSARMSLDDETGYSQGWSQLRQLAESARYVRVSAAVALARVSETENERETARALLERVIDQYPDLAEQLKPELAALKKPPPQIS